MADDRPDPLAGVDDVDWAAVDHAYGTATDVPDLLRDMAGKGENSALSAYDDVYEVLVHQGTRYSATAVAIPFLLRLLDDPRTPLRDDLLFCIITLALGLEAHDTEKPTGEAVATWLNEVKPELEDTAATVARLRQEQEAWVAAGTTKKERQTRQKLSTLQEPESSVRHTDCAYRAYCAVQDGIATIVACLADPALRAEAAAALAWFPDAQATTRPALYDLFAREAAADNGDEGLQATALFSMAVTEYIRRATAAAADDGSRPEADATVVQTLQDAYTDPRSGKLVRWAACLGLLKLGRETPEQRALVIRSRTDADDLAAYVAEAGMEREAFYYVIPLESEEITKFATRETKALAL